ncbi:MAG: endonuclease III [Alphaproteobacteria bacterium]
MKKASRADEIFRRLSAQNPEPKTELNYTNPYTLLVAVVLSAQATDAGVNRATAALFKAADTPQAMLALGEAGLKQHIKTIGLFNAKAKNVIALSQLLIEKFGGKVPRAQAELETLPGVGRKTANVVRSVIYGDETIAVDTHVFRVAHRLGLAKGNTPDKVEDELMAGIPAQWRQHAHHWLILHGRYVCKARKPDCQVCALTDLCPYYKNLMKGV